MPSDLTDLWYTSPSMWNELSLDPMRLIPSLDSSLYCHEAFIRDAFLDYYIYKTNPFHYSRFLYPVLYFFIAPNALDVYIYLYVSTSSPRISPVSMGLVLYSLGHSRCYVGAWYIVAAQYIFADGLNEWRVNSKNLLLSCVITWNPRRH